MNEYRKKRGCGVLFFLILIVTGGVVLLMNSLPSPVISPIAEPSKTGFTISKIFARKKDPALLKKKLTKAIGEEWKNYSVYVKSLTSDFEMGVNETAIYTGASINKLPIFATLYFLANKGEIDLDKTITIQEVDIQDYGTGSIRYGKPGDTYSVKTLAKLMMQQSDNTAAYILGTSVVGLESIEEYINNWGLEQTSMVDNKTSNKDMAILMEKIYKEEVASHALALEMLTFLTNTDFEDRIPSKLPPNTTVYHKTGNGLGVVHDVGIVVGPKTTYFIGILTSDVSDEEKTNALMGELSKIVFDYLNG